jgi:hypothetical protein
MGRVTDRLPALLAEARRVLEGLNRGPLPDHGDDVEAVLKGTGRVPLTAEERAVLGGGVAAPPGLRLDTATI